MHGGGAGVRLAAEDSREVGRPHGGGDEGGAGADDEKPQEGFDAVVENDGEQRRHDADGERDDGGKQGVHGGGHTDVEGESDEWPEAAGECSAHHDGGGGYAHGDDGGVGFVGAHDDGDGSGDEGDATGDGEATADALPDGDEDAARGGEGDQRPGLEHFPTGDAQEVRKPAADPEPCPWVVGGHVDVVHVG